ncbi:MAG: glycerophosphodiester phosphodiesterase [Myxococcales bacterium]|nr:glycerophosphodiester phosphodiesterase [Myxococcales bacterium]
MASGGSVWGTAPLVIGHRGGRGPGWPMENTIPAFERARAEGAAAVELDVRTCRGGEVVVVHDAVVPEPGSPGPVDSLAGRPTMGGAAPAGGVGAGPRVGLAGAPRVCDLDVSELAARGIPTLEHVLSWARAAGVGVNVEMKHDVPSRAALVRRTVAIVRRSGADVLFSSFDPWLLSMAAALAPAVPRALLFHARQPLWARALERLARPPFAGALHLELAQANPRTVERYLRRGLRLGVWTVNDPDEAAALVRGGVAAIITDRPGDVVAALARRHSQVTSSARIPGGAG